VLSYGLQRQSYIVLAIAEGRGNGRRRRLRHYLHGYGHTVAFASSIYLRYIVGEGTGHGGIDNRLCGNGSTAGRHTVPLYILPPYRDGIGRAVLTVGDEGLHGRWRRDLLHEDLHGYYGRSI